MTSFHLLGVSEFKAAIDKVIAERALATKGAITAGAHLVEATAKAALTETSHAPGTPTPSAPGQPPALVSGALRRSVLVKGPTPTSAFAFKAEIGPTMIYGRIQELGGWTGRGHATYLPPRPYMKPSLKKIGPKLEALFEDAWKF